MKKNTLMLCLFLLFVMPLTGCQNKIAVQESASSLQGRYYSSVRSDLEKLGFVDIAVDEVSDLSADNLSEDGFVSTISIGGNSNFDAGTRFHKKAPVVITYHTAQKLTLPFSADEVQDMDYQELAQMLSDAGFVHVESKEAFDIDPDEYNGERHNSVSIDYSSTFSKGDEYPLNVYIIVTSHLPYNKYEVNIHIDFPGNLIFSRYDVDCAIDYDTLGTLSHGTNGDFTRTLKEGTYKLKFSENGSSSNETEIELDVHDDLEIAYKISCESEHIKVDVLYAEYKHAAGEGQAMAPDSASELRYRDYKEVISILEDAGFTNITTEVSYDIYFGITSEGTVKSITIGDEADFLKGAVFDVDAPVVITYLMSYEKDPERNPSPTPTVSPELEPLTIENNDDFAAIMQITDQTDDLSINTFVDAYKGRIIEFDGCVIFLMQHENYKTRFDVAIANGDYTAPRVYGPLFAFENVSFYDMKVMGSDTVQGGMNFHFIARIEYFNRDGGYITLKPISLTIR